MPSVYLEDHELAEMIFERPETIVMALKKASEDLASSYETNSLLWNQISKLKARVKELEGKDQ
jgi:hypothetical protein